MYLQIILLVHKCCNCFLWRSMTTDKGTPKGAVLHWILTKFQLRYTPLPSINIVDLLITHHVYNCIDCCRIFTTHQCNSWMYQISNWQIIQEKIQGNVLINSQASGPIRCDDWRGDKFSSPWVWLTLFQKRNQCLFIVYRTENYLSDSLGPLFLMSLLCVYHCFWAYFWQWLTVGEKESQAVLYKENVFLHCVWLWLCCSKAEVNTCHLYKQ